MIDKKRKNMRIRRRQGKEKKGLHKKNDQQLDFTDKNNNKKNNV